MPAASRLLVTDACRCALGPEEGEIVPCALLLYPDDGGVDPVLGPLFVAGGGGGGGNGGVEDDEGEPWMGERDNFLPL